MSEAEVWAAFRSRLWPRHDPLELAEECRAFTGGQTLPDVTAVFIAEDDASRPIGFLELSLRTSADGCTSTPVPFIEGWYVEPGSRRRGVGLALMHAAQAWAVERGFSELASDTQIRNEIGQKAHAAFGFEEVGGRNKFRKSLRAG